MRYLIWSVTATTALMSAPAFAQGKAVSFSKEIVPILKANCAKCHGSQQPQGGFSVVSFAKLQKGGKGGKEIAAKPDDSRLVKYLEGTLQPKMPIGGSLSKEEIARIKAWIAQGAKPDVAPDLVVIPDSAIPKVKVPVIALKVPMLPEVTALAWSKDNKILAVGTYKVVKLIDPSNGQVIRELKGHADKIHCLRFSPDGTLLAAAGGPPAQQGEVKIWKVATGELVRTITGHNDCIYGCAWSPDGNTLATASYDKLIKLWDVKTGTETKTLKDHADAVYCVTFNKDGTLLASGSADRSVKVWDVASGKRIYTLAGHTDTIVSLAWSPDGRQITSTGADKSVRTWNVNAQAGNAARVLTASDGTINDVAYSPDGSMLATVGNDKTLKIWNARNGGTLHAVGDQPDALLSVAFSGDSKQVAVGGYDGSLRIYNAKDGKLASTPIEAPKRPSLEAKATDTASAAGPSKGGKAPAGKAPAKK